MSTNTLQKGNKVFSILENVFKYTFLILTLFTFNSLLSGFSNLMHVLVFATAILGAVLLIYRLIHYKNYIHTYGMIVLLLFGVSYLISTIINRQYGLMDNLQGMVWMVFQYGLLYVTDEKEPYEQDEKRYFNLLKLFSAYIFINNFISFLMLIYSYSNINFHGKIVGYVWGRLWGAYADPNDGAVLSVAVIAISVYFFVKAAHKWLKAMNVVNIIFAFLYLCFSDSRTGIVCFALLLVAFVFLFIKLTILSHKTTAKSILSILLVIVLAVGSIAVIPLTKKVYNVTAEYVYELKHSAVPDMPSDAHPEKPVEKPSGPNVIERPGDELEHDISNRRFDLWKSGIEIWEESPVFGTSFRGIQPFAEEHTPDTYMLNNSKGTKFDSTHNVLIDILVSQGVVGALIFLVFIIMVFVLVCKKMIFSKDKKPLTYENILLLVLIVNFATSGIFIPELIYTNSAIAFLFWYSLGVLVKSLKRKDQ